MIEIKVGQRASYERSFTVREVELFAELSGDKGAHHMKPDSQGRVMLHGLLTATVPTKLGGDINYIAREISCEFLRPAFAGETIRADSVVTSVEPAENHLKVAMDFVCYNPSGKEVLRGKTRGVIRTKP